MINPKRPSGFNELLPADQLAFNAMVAIIKMSYEQYGYAPIETPALELSHVLLAKEGGETAKQVYRFSKGDTDLSMRFDLTIPLARYAAEHYNDLAFPFRRYQIQEVWRAEKAQAGRYRQFYQCDVDILGSKSPLADADVILGSHNSFRALGLKNIIFKISHRGLLSGFLEQNKLSKYTTEILRSVDKFDKLGENGVMAELTKTGLAKNQIKEVISFINNSGSAKTIIQFLVDTKINNEIFSEAVNNLKQVTKLLSAGGMKTNEIVIDLSIARGFDYYTGIVFEMFLDGQAKIGSVGSGGRYDNLLASYRRDPIPGVGASIGLSRLFGALKETIQNGPANPAQVVIHALGEDAQVYSLEIANTLRKSGLNVLVYPGSAKIDKRFAYNDKLGIPLAILCGGDEAAKRTVTIKNLKTGKQISVPLAKASSTIKKVL